MVQFFGVAQIFKRQFAWEAIRNWSEELLFAPSAEISRLVVLLIAGGWLYWPFFVLKAFGAADTQAMICLLADTLEQARHGVFPVWISQSHYAFTGLIFPLRYAPMFQQLGLLIDFLTFHLLGVYSVLALELILSGFGGLIICYAAIRSVASERPWLAMLLAWLYVSCPGVFGLLPLHDMIMTWMGLPWVPLVFWGMARSLQKSDALSRLLQALGLSVLVWCHPPLAMWSLSVALAVFLWRIIQRTPRVNDFLWDGLAALIFVAIAFYPLVSFHFLGHKLNGPSGAFLGPSTDAPSAYQFVEANFPNLLLPLNSTGPKVLQLGYGLILAMIIGWWRLGVKPRQPFLPFGLSALFFVILLFPLPIISRFVICHLPSVIFVINRLWLDQRLNLILAVTIVFLVAGVSNQIKVAARLQRWFSLGLFIVILWSCYQINFLRKVQTDRTGDASKSQWLLGRGATIFGNYFYTLEDFTFSRYDWKIGVVDPAMELHVLDNTGEKIIASNVETVAPGYGPASQFEKKSVLVQMKSSRSTQEDGALDLSPSFLIQPRQSYLLAFSFLQPDLKGQLILLGDHFREEYTLPLSGSPRAFGSEGESSRVLTMKSVWDEAKEIRLRLKISPQTPIQGNSEHVLDAALIGYEEKNLPLRIESFIPLRVSVETSSGGWLETFRHWYPGYSALVDGRPAEIKASPDGMVMIMVPPGLHRAELSYRVDPFLSFAYFLSLGVFFLVLFIIIFIGKRPFNE